MNQHRFSVGDHVTPISDLGNRAVRRSVYIVVQKLPTTDQGHAVQYRVKSVLDDFERVIDDSDLRRISLAADGDGSAAT